MSVIGWPHAHLPHALCAFLADAGFAGGRWYTRIPRDRVYPLGTVQSAGLGPLGTDSHIGADQPRVQIDAWAETEEEALTLFQQVFQALDFRFVGAVRDVVWETPDDVKAGVLYRTRVERIERSGGGESYLDEYARVWRVTGFYNLKVSLGA